MNSSLIMIIGCMLIVIACAQFECHNISITMYSPSYDQIGIDGIRSMIKIDNGSNLVIKNSASNYRGHNVIVIDEITGEMNDSITFDTWSSAPGGTEDALLANYLNSIKTDRIVAVTIYDTGNAASASHLILQSWGCTAPQPGGREPFIFIGTASTVNIPYWQYCVTSSTELYLNAMIHIPIMLSITMYSPSWEQHQINGLYSMIEINNGKNLIVHNDRGEYRGHNIVVINEITGEMIDSASFDTYYGSQTQDSSMADYLNSIRIDRIVAITVYDTGGASNISHSILQSWGCAVNKPGYREPFIFIGTVSTINMPYWQYSEIAPIATFINKTINIQICVHSEAPTLSPSQQPSLNPTPIPSQNPTLNPTYVPSNIPTTVPTNIPSKFPSTIPTKPPSRLPTIQPSTNEPTKAPTRQPTKAPTKEGEVIDHKSTATRTQEIYSSVIVAEDINESFLDKDFLFIIIAGASFFICFMCLSIIWFYKTKRKKIKQATLDANISTDIGVNINDTSNKNVFLNTTSSQTNLIQTDGMINMVNMTPMIPNNEDNQRIDVVTTEQLPDLPTEPNENNEKVKLNPIQPKHTTLTAGNIDDNFDDSDNDDCDLYMKQSVTVTTKGTPL